MQFNKKDIIERICKIREEIGHQRVNPGIKDILYNEKKGVMLIITTDRPQKSAVIGKGGWVVGKLKEDLDINSIHVEAYPDIQLIKYRTKLAKNKLNKLIKIHNLNDYKPLSNLNKLLTLRFENPYDFESLLNEFDENKEDKDQKAVVALSGGVDSSFSLIVAKKIGFNPVAITVNPGSIILPQYFQKNVEELSAKLGVPHHYLEVTMDEIINDSLKGRFHPCGRCSKIIEDTVLNYAKEIQAQFLIYGDLLTTGTGSIVKDKDIIKINLPAMLAVNKGEIKQIASKYGILKKAGYGCPLINEVHKKYPYMKKFSIQRILRETRAGVLEPGEALDMITKSIK